MVEAKDCVFDHDAFSVHSPPLVPAHVIPDLDSLEPIAVNAVTIQEVTIDEPTSPTTSNTTLPSWESASVISIDSVMTEPMPPAPVDKSTQAWSAGIGAGVLGTLVGGPVIGAVAAGTAVFYSSKDGMGGDTARALGDVARTTGDKARELNRKHSLVDKSKQAAGSAWRKVKGLDKEHKLAKKGQEAASTAWENAKQFNRKHGVIEKLGAFAALCFTRFAKIVTELSGRLLKNEPEQQQTRIPQKVATCY